jgi:hypothetical protein
MGDTHLDFRLPLKSCFWSLSKRTRPDSVEPLEQSWQCCHHAMHNWDSLSLTVGHESVQNPWLLWHLIAANGPHKLYFHSSL